MARRTPHDVFANLGERPPNTFLNWRIAFASGFDFAAANARVLPSRATTAIEAAVPLMNHPSFYHFQILPAQRGRHTLAQLPIAWSPTGDFRSCSVQ